jgi:hypothetical protein
MIRNILIFLLLLLIFAQVASAAADIDLEISTSGDKDEFISGGSVVIPVKISNPSGSFGPVSNIEITGSGGDFSFSAGALIVSGDAVSTLESGKTASVDVTVTGFVWSKTRIKIEVEGSSPDFDVNGDSVSVDIVPPDLDIEIISPETDLTLVDVEENSTYSFDALIRNTGDWGLEEVTMELQFKESEIDCRVGGKERDIAIGGTSKFLITCSNIGSGKKITIRVQDKNKAVFDIKNIEFTLVESFKNRQLEITSPVENQEFRVGDYGGSVDVTVQNIGEAALDEVCASVSNMEHAADACVSLIVGTSHTFTINLVPFANVTNAKIVVSDSTGDASDDVVVRILKLSAIVPVKNDTPIVENTTVVVPTNGTVEGPEEEAQLFGIPQWLFVSIVILVPLILLGIYVKISIGRVQV